jgi:hypothetical protein
VLYDMCNNRSSHTASMMCTGALEMRACVQMAGSGGGAGWLRATFGGQQVRCCEELCEIVKQQRLT